MATLNGAGKANRIKKPLRKRYPLRVDSSYFQAVEATWVVKIGKGILQESSDDATDGKFCGKKDLPTPGKSNRKGWNAKPTRDGTDETRSDRVKSSETD